MIIGSGDVEVTGDLDKLSQWSGQGESLVSMGSRVSGGKGVGAVVIEFSFKGFAVNRTK